MQRLAVFAVAVLSNALHAILPRAARASIPAANGT
jgi:hypothetical protein